MQVRERENFHVVRGDQWDRHLVRKRRWHREEDVMRSSSEVRARHPNTMEEGTEIKDTGNMGKKRKNEEHSTGKEELNTGRRRPTSGGGKLSSSKSQPPENIVNEFNTLPTLRQ